MDDLIYLYRPAIQWQPSVLSNRFGSIGAITVGNFSSTERTAISVIVDNSTTKPSKILQQFLHVFIGDAEMQIGDNQLSVVLISHTITVGDRGETLTLPLEICFTFVRYIVSKILCVLFLNASKALSSSYSFVGCLHT